MSRSLSNSGRSYELPPASSTVLGGIKVGTNLTIDSSGSLNSTATSSLSLGSAYPNATVSNGLRLSSQVNTSTGITDYRLAVVPTVGAFTVVDANTLEYTNIPSTATMITVSFSGLYHQSPTPAYIGVELGTAAGSYENSFVSGNASAIATNNDNGVVVIGQMSNFGGVLSVINSSANNKFYGLITFMKNTSSNTWVYTSHMHGTNRFDRGAGNIEISGVLTKMRIGATSIGGSAHIKIDSS
jgi:hypothetical protein